MNLRAKLILLCYSISFLFLVKWTSFLIPSTLSCTCVVDPTDTVHLLTVLMIPFFGQIEWWFLVFEKLVEQALHDLIVPEIFGTLRFFKRLLLKWLILLEINYHFWTELENLNTKESYVKVPSLLNCRT